MEDLTYFWAVVLGLIQGLTEFIPVSSSGHLALAQHLGRGVKEDIAYDVLLHLATVLAVLGAFYRDIIDYVREPQKRVILLYIIIGSIPVGIVGLLLKDWLEGLGGYPLLVSVCLLITAALLMACELVNRQERGLKALGWTGALIVGLFQVAGMLPGISRSGSTIAAGVFCGLHREAAVKFSFLLMVPAVCGANLLKVIKDPEQFAALPLGPALAGFAVATISGFLAIRAMLRIVQARRLRWFALYCLLAGTAGLVYFGLLAG